MPVLNATGQIPGKHALSLGSVSALLFLTALLFAPAPAYAQEDPRDAQPNSAPRAGDVPKDWKPGMPLPPGFHVANSRRTKLIIAGATTLGGGYWVAVVAGSLMVANHAYLVLGE